MSRKYAVYCTADDNYVFPSIVALQSVRRFHPECDFFVIGNQSIISKKKLGVLKKFDIHFLHSDQNELFAGSRWPSTCYLALLGPEMLWEKGYEYSLGLDADILCVQSLDLDEVFSMTVGYAGIENQGPRRGNFEDPDFIRHRYKLNEEALNSHNTNTGVVFWNNRKMAESKLWEYSIKCFRECTAENPRMIRGDQSLFALVSILEPALPWLILHRGYNYRVHNASDQKEDIKEEDIRIYHFTGPKPWESVPIKERLLNPSLLLHRDKYFAFLAGQGEFNRDLTIKNRGAVERISTSVRYSFDDWMTAIFIKPPVVSGISAFISFVRKAKAGFRKVKAGLFIKLRRIWHYLMPSAPSQRKRSCFYKLSPTCQIPKLNVTYEQYFGRRTDGCFVEVGAYDGEYASNTSGLADIGWSGYYIGPVSEYFQRCKVRHARNKSITVSQCAIGAEQGKVEINVGGALSTISDEMRQHFDHLDWAKGSFKQQKKVRVEQLTLGDYLVRHGVKPQFELLVVDVEGYEWNVLRNFDIQKWRPQMAIIELHDQNDDYPLIREDCNNIVRYFDDNGYKVILKDFTNTIYVPKDSCPRFSYRT